MKRILIAAAAVAMMASCSTPSRLLYSWGEGSSTGTTRYETLSYTYYDKQTPEALCNLIALYENMVTKPGGTRGVPPPGICAEYGYLLMNPETLQAFNEHATEAQRKLFKDKDLSTYFNEHGQEMFELEMKYYPESVTFIEPLLKKLSAK